jgi:anti-sigma factor RsiW
MPVCVLESTLIRLVSGELPPREREQVLQHLHGCAECRHAWEELRHAWDLLDQATVTLPARDLAGSVLARAAVLRGRRARWASLARVAAVIALASGLGIVAGLLAPSRSEQLVTTHTVSDEQVTEALGLNDLEGGADLLAGLFDSAEEEQATHEEQTS